MYDYPTVVVGAGERVSRDVQPWVSVAERASRLDAEDAGAEVDVLRDAGEMVADELVLKSMKLAQLRELWFVEQ